MNGPADPFAPVVAGEPAELNALAANMMREAALRELQRPRSRSLATPGQPITYRIAVNNVGETDVDRRGALAISGGMFDDSEAGDVDRLELPWISRGRLILGGDVIDEPTVATPTAIALEPIKAGYVGAAMLMGVTTALIDVRHEDHGYAKLKPSSAQLESSHAGLWRIIWKPAGTGDKPAIVASLPSIAPSMFSVILEQTGGTDGSTSTQPSYTYTVKDDAEFELATNVAPEYRTWSAGFASPATTGLAYYNAAGELKLRYADEVWSAGPC